jgi:hypothetical protein
MVLIRLLNHKWSLSTIPYFSYIMSQFYWCSKPEYPEKITDLPQVTVKLLSHNVVHQNLTLTIFLCDIYLSNYMYNPTTIMTTARECTQCN